LLPLAAQTFTVFHAIGIVFACWAVLVTALGVRRPDFPGKVKGAGEKAVVGISVTLALGSVGTAIFILKGEKEKPKAEAAAPSAAGAAAPGSAAKGPAQQLKLSADPTGNLKFNTNTLSAKAGTVRITLSNPAPLSHNVTLQTPQGVKGGPTVPQGGTSTVLATLKPGTYTYYCSVPGHRQAGMQGTLTVH
jgi:plastocyanin